MVSACPDSSTECLLRALLDAQSGFNWNPLSFAFTAAIGVLALVVAGATVFQGLLSAGPGRLKASKASMGIYAFHTKTSFDWNELRYRTTTRVPFIRGFHGMRSLAPPHFRKKINSFPARWVTLLDAAGLYFPSGLKGSDSLGSENDKLVSVVTDHVPADIAAPPAWTTVCTAVQLACIAGCDVITMTKESPYPTVRGPGCQLRFRDHPDLGTIAVFDLFVKNRPYPFLEEGFQEVLLEYTHGPAAYRSCFAGLDSQKFELLLTDLRVRCNDCGHALCRSLLKESPASGAWGGILDPKFWAYWTGIGRIFRPLVSQIPLSFRAADLMSTTKISSLRRIVQSLRDQCPDCRGKQPFLSLRTFCSEIEDAIPRRPYIPHQFAHSGWSWLYATEGNRQRPYIHMRYKDEEDSNLRIISWKILDFVGQLLKSKDRKLVSRYFTEARHILEFQLQEVDWWLVNHGGSEAACESIALVHDTWDKISQFPGLFDEAFSNNVLDADLVAAAAPTTGPFSPAQDQEEVLSARPGMIRTILLFRAALWTAFLYPDDTLEPVMQGELGNRIVQLL